MVAMNPEQIRECLTDAGCDEELIRRFETMRCSVCAKEQLRFLNDYRHQLLEKIHLEQKKLDCLDYLLYALKTGTTV